MDERWAAADTDLLQRYVEEVIGLQPTSSTFPERETPPVAGSAQAGSGFLNLLPTDVEGRWQSKHASRQASARHPTHKHIKKCNDDSTARMAAAPAIRLAHVWV